MGLTDYDNIFAQLNNLMVSLGLNAFLWLSQAEQPLHDSRPKIGNMGRFRLRTAQIEIE